MDFVVLGNGFVGSDMRDVPGDVSTVDVRYLLLPRLKGQSVFDAMKAYEERSSQHEAAAQGEMEINTLTLGEVRVDLPSWTYEA